MPSIHPTAVVDRTAELADDVCIGPWCVIGPKVSIGPRSILRNHVVVESHTRMGADNIVYPFATLGGTPQDRKYRGEETWCEIGDRNHFREQVTVHRGTATGGGATVIGNGNLLMVGVHVAHDCRIADEVTIANAVLLAGHVHVGTGATIGGNAAFHHFVTVGAASLVGGLARVTKDVPPYLIVEGSPARIRGHNQIQMTRRGASDAAIEAIRTAYRRLFCEAGATMTVRIAELRAQFPAIQEVHELCDALLASAAGVHGRALERARTDDKRSVPAMWQPTARPEGASAEP
ncbi:MAG: acyl-ACP--UDP-N-acetylglucosamine O-acyltransferase [Phycisphaera sp.]|nr:acyl-ACP--UDP-N-acetylglucosamine O-acyltransferase [Phycisphaera sp.]